MILLRIKIEYVSKLKLVSKKLTIAIYNACLVGCLTNWKRSCGVGVKVAALNRALKENDLLLSGDVTVLVSV